MSGEATEEAAKEYAIVKSLKNRNINLKKKLEEAQSESKTYEVHMMDTMTRGTKALSIISDTLRAKIGRSIEESCINLQTKLDEIDSDVARRLGASNQHAIAAKQDLGLRVAQIEGLRTQLRDVTSQLAINSVEDHTIEKLESDLACSEDARIGAEFARDVLFNKKEGMLRELKVEARKVEQLNQEVELAKVNNETMFGEIQNLKMQLSTEQNLTQELRQNLDTSRVGFASMQARLAIAKEDLDLRKVSLASVQKQLKTTTEDLSRSKSALEEFAMESSNTRKENEKERTASFEKEKQLLVRIGALMQERQRAKFHPFRTFIMNLLDKILGRGTPVLRWIGGMMYWNRG